MHIEICYIAYIMRQIMKNLSLLENFNLCSRYRKSNPTYKNIGLVSGSSAYILYFYYVHEITNNHKYKEQLSQLIEGQLEGINSNFNLSSGLSALCLVLYWIGHDHLLSEQMEEIDLLIEKEYNLSLNKNDMDYFHGASGYLFYFMTTKRCKRLDILVAKYIQQVSENFNKNDWYTPFYQKDAKPAMVVNMGTPHGITGILLILLMAFENGYPVVIPTIMEVCDFLLENRFAKKEKSFFPSAIKRNGEKTGSGIAWCYGDLMASYAILKTGILLKHSYYKEVGYQMLLQLNERTDYLKNDLCLCHGHSSLILIYKSIYELTCDKLFWQRHLFWHGKTKMLLETKIAEYKQGTNSDSFLENLSLFAGFPGSFLSLFAPEIENNKWSKILLL